MKKYYFSDNSELKLNKVHKDLQTVLRLAITYAPFDFGITSGLRTAEEQFELFKQGRELINGVWKKTGKTITKCDGEKNISPHQNGVAVDILAYYKNKNIWAFDDKTQKTIFSQLIGYIKGVEKKCFLTGLITSKFEYGADWGWDFPHIEIKV